MATHQLNYATHQLENLQLPSEETALNFQYWDVSSCKPSPEAWTTICSPRGLGPDLQKANLKWRWSLEHLSPVTAGLSVPCVLGLSPAGNSSSVHGRGCCKKRHHNIESLKRSLRKAATGFPVDVLCNSIGEWPQRLKDCVCVLMVAILNNYLQFWFITHPCSSCY